MLVLTSPLLPTVKMASHNTRTYQNLRAPNPVRTHRYLPLAGCCAARLITCIANDLPPLLALCRAIFLPRFFFFHSAFVIVLVVSPLDFGVLCTTYVACLPIPCFYRRTGATHSAGGGKVTQPSRLIPVLASEAVPGEPTKSSKNQGEWQLRRGRSPPTRNVLASTIYLISSHPKRPRIASTSVA